MEKKTIILSALSIIFGITLVALIYFHVQLKEEIFFHKIGILGLNERINSPSRLLRSAENNFTEKKYPPAQMILKNFMKSHEGAKEYDRARDLLNRVDKFIESEKNEAPIKLNELIQKYDTRPWTRPKRW